MRSVGFHLVAAIALVTLVHAALGATPCGDLAQLKLPDTTIDTARDVAAGDYTPAGPIKLSGVAALPLSPDAAADPLGPAALHNLPAFCRVHGVVSPVPGSRIGFELWLPKLGWNWRLLMLGNGGYSSSNIIQHGDRAEGRLRHFGNGYWSHGRRPRFRSRALGGDYRLGTSRGSRISSEGEADYYCLLWATRTIRLLRGLLDGRPPGLHGGATVSRGLQWHPGR